MDDQGEKLRGLLSASEKRQRRSDMRQAIAQILLIIATVCITVALMRH